MNQLLVAGSWGLDVAFFVILLLGIFLGVKRGLVESLCKLAGTLLSVAIAITFCVSLSNLFENWFGMTTALGNAFANILPNVEVGRTVGKYVAIAICFVILILVVRLAAWGVGKLGTALTNHFAPFRIINRILGGILGAFGSLMLIFIALAICYWIPNETVHNFIADSTIVSKIFAWVSNELAKIDLSQLFPVVPVEPEAVLFR